MVVERLLLEDDRNAACERARAGGVLCRHVARLRSRHRHRCERAFGTGRKAGRWDTARRRSARERRWLGVHAEMAIIWHTDRLGLGQVRPEVGNGLAHAVAAHE
jgi:hypothetical protein